MHGTTVSARATAASTKIRSSSRNIYLCIVKTMTVILTESSRFATKFYPYNFDALMNWVLQVPRPNEFGRAIPLFIPGRWPGSSS
jgi:hypothetical protein